MLISKHMISLPREVDGVFVLASLLRKSIGKSWILKLMSVLSPVASNLIEIPFFSSMLHSLRCNSAI